MFCKPTIYTEATFGLWLLNNENTQKQNILHVIPD